MFRTSNYYRVSPPPHMRSELVVGDGAPTLVEPITLAQGKQRAGLNWVTGDDRDELMLGFIATARAKVEFDTGRALPTQQRDVYLDAMPRGWTPVELPSQSIPLQSVDRVTYIDSTGMPVIIDPVNYDVDLVSARIAVAMSGALWPTNLRYLQPWVIRITCGYPTGTIPPMLVHAVGLLVGHFATAGRDIAEIQRGVAIEMPFGYQSAIDPYVLESVA
jgi:uncharacterized phiE125 gp8 family phage protein